MKKIIAIEGMSCGHCAGRVTEALEKIQGVEKVNINLAEKSAMVELSFDIEDRKISETVDDAGYEVKSIQNI